MSAVKPLPLDPDERLAKWIAWSDKWLTAWCEGDDWTKAASWFFQTRFATDDGMFRFLAEWCFVDATERTARLDRGKNADLVWKFIDLGGGKWRPKLVGTVEV